MPLAISQILVLCEGNHCRSPLAEAFLRKALGPGIQVRSAGLDAMVGHPAHEESMRLASEHGLELFAHRGRQFNAEVAREADLILVMDHTQKVICERLLPSARGRVYLLGHWLLASDQEIADPIRGGAETHRQSCEHILRAMAPWMHRLSPRLPRIQ